MSDLKVTGETMAPACFAHCSYYAWLRGVRHSFFFFAHTFSDKSFYLSLSLVFFLSDKISMHIALLLCQIKIRRFSFMQISFLSGFLRFIDKRDQAYLPPRFIPSYPFSACWQIKLENALFKQYCFSAERQ